MAISKETKESAFRACSLSEEDIVIMLLVYIEKYQQARRNGESEEEKHSIFLGIEELSLIVLMKAMNKDPLQIIDQLNHIEKAVEIVTPHKG